MIDTFEIPAPSQTEILSLPIEDPHQFPNDVKKQFENSTSKHAMKPFLDEAERIRTKGTPEEQSNFADARAIVHELVTNVVNYVGAADAVTDTLAVPMAEYKKTAAEATTRAELAEEHAKRLEAENESIRQALQIKNLESALAEIARVQSELQINTASTDASENERRMREAQLQIERITDIAFKDPVTGLWNRRSYDEDIAKEHQRAIDQNQALSVIEIDGNGMKIINDTYTHLVGDIYIEEIASIIQSALRDGDRAYRFGGDEFMVLLPGLTPHEASILGDRINDGINQNLLANVQRRVREKIMQAEYQRRQKDKGENNKKHQKGINKKILKREEPLTASLGVHGFAAGESISQDELKQGVDVALYNAKLASKENPTERAGKVAIYTEGMTMPDDIEEDDDAVIDESDDIMDTTFKVE